MAGALLQPCTPPFWARGGHAQTLLGHLLPSPALTAPFERLEIPTTDGDRIVALHFKSSPDAGAVVYAFHGLGGSHESRYMLRTARLALARGHHVILANHRGAGLGRGLAAKPYHSGRAEDLSAVIRRGRELHPNARHLAAGFSLSGNALLLLASGARGDTLPDAAIAVNAPIDLTASALALARGLNRIYDLQFVGDCRRAIVDPERYPVPRLATVYELDRLYTAPASGFASREEYYATCSTKPRLKNIRIPTILLTAKDDPFIDYLHYVEAERPPNVRLRLEEHGGHLGYLSADKTPLGTRRWLDYALDAFMGELL